MLRSGHHNTQVERPSVGFRTARDSLHDVEIGAHREQFHQMRLAEHAIPVERPVSGRGQVEAR